MKRFFIAAALALPFFAPLASHAAVDAQETKKLHALFYSTWEDSMRRHPEQATEIGDYRYNDKLTDRR